MDDSSPSGFFVPVPQPGAVPGFVRVDPCREIYFTGFFLPVTGRHIAGTVRPGTNKKKLFWYLIYMVMCKISLECAIQIFFAVSGSPPPSTYIMISRPRFIA